VCHNRMQANTTAPTEVPQQLQVPVQQQTILDEMAFLQNVEEICQMLDVPDIQEARKVMAYQRENKRGPALAALGEALRAGGQDPDKVAWHLDLKKKIQDDAVADASTVHLAATLDRNLTIT